MPLLLVIIVHTSQPTETWCEIMKGVKWLRVKTDWIWADIALFYPKQCFFLAMTRVKTDRNLGVKPWRTRYRDGLGWLGHTCVAGRFPCRSESMDQAIDHEWIQFFFFLFCRKKKAVCLAHSLGIVPLKFENIRHCSLMYKNHGIGTEDNRIRIGWLNLSNYTNCIRFWENKSYIIFFGRTYSLPHFGFAP